MSNEISALQPQSLWSNFAKLNAIPRASKKEEKVIAFMKKFGESLNLDTHVDHIGNVIIRKQATAGREHHTPVVLQGHLDMVHQKNASTSFNFDTQGIDMFIEGDWVKAKGTTLGADNGIGVAAIMAILESNDIPHPPIEALFTIDEETGMTGAMELKAGLLHGRILLNLDTEDDNELTIGCAGGIDITATGQYKIDQYSNEKTYRVAIRGLSGGHSGMDIHKGLGNANKIMNRFLYHLNKQIDLGIHSIDGGGLRNAIPRESVAILVVGTHEQASFISFVKQFSQKVIKEYLTTDPDMEIGWQEIDSVSSVLEKEFQNKLLRSIYTCPNGIYRMSPDVEGLVQTSNNLARVLVKEGKYEILCLTRSSVDTEKMDEVEAIRSAFELMGASVRTSGAYPGWTPNPSASITKLMSDLYEEMYEEKPHVNACHAGLECGILGTNYPEMEMISFGPNIRGAHSPDEKCQISSVQKFWGYFIETLKRIE